MTEADYLELWEDAASMAVSLRRTAPTYSRRWWESAVRWRAKYLAVDAAAVRYLERNP